MTAARVQARVLGVLLAGGQARRMGGGDKCLHLLAGRPILTHVIERLGPQVDGLILNANGDPSRFAAFDLPVAADTIEGFAGPLAGVLAGMEWAAAHRPDCPWIVTAATDSPFLPLDLVEGLEKGRARANARLACATSLGRAHPVFGLWPVDLAADLRKAITTEGIRKVDAWTARFPIAAVPFAAPDHDPFFNTNRPEDLALAEQLAS